MRAALLALVVSAQAPAQPPVLGSPSYVPPYGRGWGEVAPAEFSNGGVPSGHVIDVAWSGWGDPVATGTGRNWLYRPSGGYFRRPGRVQLRVEGLGTCPGEDRPAYTLLFVRAPQWPGGPLGPWLKWSGTRTICDYEETDPEYEYPRRPPGDCGDAGRRAFAPGKVFSIAAYVVPCDQARRVAAAIAATRWPRRCLRRGCARTIEGLDCRLERLRRGEVTPDFRTVSLRRPYPAQRVACVSSAGGNFSAWQVAPRR
ncbi:MAG TPA: hypothetical protein VGW75_08750 [Solirubrobacteraceae bacterium]|nr:hypothetical protein [Solirubrobacteraceae bacterium]